MRRLLLAAVLLLAPVAPSALAGGVEPPTVSIATVEQLPQPLPLPYDETAHADLEVAKALRRAKESGKRVLLDFGGNWCPDCRVLAGVMELPEVKAFIDRHFETVIIDVGRMDKNMHIPARFGVPKMKGVPHVLILDSDGTPLNPDDTGDLPNARRKKPQAIADWLAQWAKPVPAG